MNNKVLGCLVAGALATTLALAPPALARGGGGGGGGGRGGGGGMHGGGMHFGGHFAGAHFVRAGFSPRFSRLAFRDHRFHRFAFVGVPFGYAAYSSCWRKVWTPYGLRLVDVCGDYGDY
jgi:hypothetical protein